MEGEGENKQIWVKAPWNKRLRPLQLGGGQEEVEEEEEDLNSKCPCYITSDSTAFIWAYTLI